VASGSESNLEIPKSLNPQIPAHTNPQSLIPNPSLSTTHYPLSTAFVIATPTALVTDLGTEFGVDVDRNNATTIHVIRGEVEASREAVGGSPIRERLRAGQAIYIASLNALPQRIDPPKYALSTHRRAAGQPVRAVFSPEVKAILRELHKARQSQQICEPIGLVASAYHRVFDKNGKLLAENDRQLAFQVATDGVFGRGFGEENACSSFDTGVVGSGQWIVDSAKKEVASGQRSVASDNKKVDSGQCIVGSASRPSSNPQSLISNPSLSTPHSPLPTAFVGLRYDHAIRFDRIKVFLGRQSDDGGCWAKPPRVFILKKPVDTNSTPPENDPANWREAPWKPLVGSAFQPEPCGNPGTVLEIALTALSEEDSTGYGWAVGGVPGNGSGQYISVTELRAYTMPDEEELKRNTQIENNHKKDQQEKNFTQGRKDGKS
jgi:hypothetical protein